jgi:hypothetical protein
VDRSDLTGFAALLGESLSARVDLLGRLLQSVHYPSLGQYKERLLADTVRGYLPSSVQVGSGFVLFPHTDEAPPAGALHDPLNQSAFSISRQCDILIYDDARFPPIFRDQDFVVVRPEAVRAVIEVKGAISLAETRKALNAFDDFGRKWRRTQLFYRAHHQPMTDVPGMYVMAWNAQRRQNGSPAITPARIAAEIADFYRRSVSVIEADGYPFLTQLHIHNECEISAIHGVELDESGSDEMVAQFGWLVQDGRFVRIDSHGLPYRDRDRTVASLLASLHTKVVPMEHFNRFFSYADEVRGQDVLGYRHHGITWAYEDLSPEEARQFTANTPRPTKR